MSRKRGKETDDYEYDKRYGDRWVNISREARTKIKTCCLCLDKPSEVTHHACYTDVFGDLILNDLILGVHIFPLCRECHSKVHSTKNWIFHAKKDPRNQNTKRCLSILSLNYQILISGD